ADDAAGFGDAMCGELSAATRLVADPAGFGKALQHTRDRRGLHAQAAGNDCGRNHLLGAAQAVDRLQVVLDPTARVVGHTHTFGFGSRRARDSRAPASSHYRTVGGLDTLVGPTPSGHILASPAHA